MATRAERRRPPLDDLVLNHGVTTMLISFSHIARVVVDVLGTPAAFFGAGALILL